MIPGKLTSIAIREIPISQWSRGSWRGDEPTNSIIWGWIPGVFNSDNMSCTNILQPCPPPNYWCVLCSQDHNASPDGPYHCTAHFKQARCTVLEYYSTAAHTTAIPKNNEATATPPPEAWTVLVGALRWWLPNRAFLLFIVAALFLLPLCRGVLIVSIPVYSSAQVEHSALWGNNKTIRE